MAFEPTAGHVNTPLIKEEELIITSIIVINGRPMFSAPNYVIGMKKPPNFRNTENIKDMEENVRDLYTSEGLYTVFKMGYFPVPYLWEGKEEFSNAVDWITKIIDGGIFVVDEQGRKMSVRERLERIRNLSVTP